MNRILFEHGEIIDGAATIDDARAEHILRVLHGEVGQTLKTGEIDGLVGTGVIAAIDGARVTVRLEHRYEALAPWADLILAPPRPRVFKRLLPQLAALGVRNIFLVGARKVEKDFWGATVLKEENYRPLLIDGLMQAGTAALPILHVRRNLRKFLAEELHAALPSTRRVIAHPYATGGKPADCGNAAIAKNDTLTLAVGPEGGWTDDEVSLFESHGFSRFSLGPRILRTDTATVALLACLSQD